MTEMIETERHKKHKDRNTVRQKERQKDKKQKYKKPRKTEKYFNL